MPFLIHVWILDVYDCAWSVIPNKKNNQKRKKTKIPLSIFVGVTPI